MVFFVYDKDGTANFVEAGGVYEDLYRALVERKEREEEIATVGGETI